MSPRYPYRHIDIRLVSSDVLHFYILHFTTGVEYSKQAKMIEKKKGYKLTPYALINVKTGKKVSNLKYVDDIIKKLDL